MTAHTSATYRRFTRDTDRAVLAGVCAGIANYFGFNLCATRVLFVIACFAAMPIPLIAYIAIVFLVPAESSRHGHAVKRESRRRRRRMSRRERAQVAEEEGQQAADAFDERRRSLDERLARIEKYVTSSRYSLDREFRNL